MVQLPDTITWRHLKHPSRIPLPDQRNCTIGQEQQVYKKNLVKERWRKYLLFTQFSLFKFFCTIISNFCAILIPFVMPNLRVWFLQKLRFLCNCFFLPLSNNSTRMAGTSLSHTYQSQASKNTFKRQVHVLHCKPVSVLVFSFCRCFEWCFYRLYRVTNGTTL